MYTKEQVHRAIETLVRLGHSYSETVRELGCPSDNCLRGWWRDYEANGAVVERACHREPKYDEGHPSSGDDHNSTGGTHFKR